MHDVPSDQSLEYITQRVPALHQVQVTITHVICKCYKYWGLAAHTKLDTNVYMRY